MANRLKPFAAPAGDEAYDKPKTFPDRLTFGHAHFHRGLNLTVRRGDKWYGFRGEIDVDDVVGNVLMRTTVEETLLMRFLDIPAPLLTFEHDSACRTMGGLYYTLLDMYPDFTAAEAVTLVFFRTRVKPEIFE